MNKKSRRSQNAGLDFRAADYMAAAVEHAKTLRMLYDLGFFVLAIYVSGLAVESMLRAYRLKVSSEFDSRHDLGKLAEISKFVEIVPSGQRGRFTADLSVVVQRWSNNHRYRTATMLVKRLKKLGLCRGIRGDALKENTRQCVNASLSLVSLGEVLWKP